MDIVQLDNSGRFWNQLHEEFEEQCQSKIIRDLWVCDMLTWNENAFLRGLPCYLSVSLVQVSSLPSRGFQWHILLHSWPAVRQNIHVTPNTHVPTNFFPMTSLAFTVRWSWTVTKCQGWMLSVLLAWSHLLFIINSYYAKMHYFDTERHGRSIVKPHRLTNMLATAS